ncbi:MAG: hypothetical protein ACHQ4G_01835 [Opitutales bacterium]
MSFAEFKDSLGEAEPPAGLSAALAGLWHEARGDWTGAHRAVQDEVSAEAAWVHAYLHRKEGDAGNAAYWYARARRPRSDLPLAEEWTTIARALLHD